MAVVTGAIPLQAVVFQESTEDILESAPFGFISTLPDGTITQVNATFLSWTGNPPATLEGKRFQDLLTVPSRIFYKTHSEPLLHLQGFIKEIACQLERKGGEPLQVLVNSSLKLDATGKPLVIRTFIFDISERKRTEDALRRSYGTYLNLIQNNPLGVYLVDADFRLAQVSAGAQKVFSSVRPLVGRDFGEVLRIVWQDPFAGEAIARFRHTLATGERYHSRDTTEKRADIEVVESYDWQVERVTLPDDRFGVVCYFYDMTERKRYEEHISLLMAEVNHRAKNLLAVVQAVARQTARSGDPATFMTRLSERLAGLARSHDQLVKNQWRGVEVHDLTQDQLVHFKDLFGTRILIEGPPAQLNPAAAQAIGMALHELTTNAGKYGALSNSAGRVRIIWDIEVAPKPAFTMQWLEEDGPEVAPPSQSGFGQMVMVRMAEQAVDGTVELAYRSSGLSWRLTAALDSILDASEGGG